MLYYLQLLKYYTYRSVKYHKNFNNMFLYYIFFNKLNNEVSLVFKKQTIVEN